MALPFDKPVYINFELVVVECICAASASFPERKKERKKGQKRQTENLNRT